jgi:hypothetical protein
MKAKAILTAILSIVLAGCSLRAKPKAVVPPATPKPAASPAPTPPPPAPLSIPQTNVALPKPQPVDPAALVLETKPPEPEPPSAPPARPRRTTQAAPTATPPPATVTPPPEPPRETFQEVVSPVEAKRLLEQARTWRKEVRQILDQLGRRTLTPAEKNVVATIQSFLTLSEEAEKHSDPRQAVAHADRAHILAKELQSGQ